MTSPPPIPNSGKKMPRWVWGWIALGVVMFLVSSVLFGWLFYVGQKTIKGTKLMAEQPKRGVKYYTGLDEELSVGPQGEFRYKDKKTGAQRTIWTEGDKALPPVWLNIPPGAERLSASAVHSKGRRDASFDFSLEQDPAEVSDFMRRQLQELKFTIRSGYVERPWDKHIVNGEDDAREAFITVERDDTRDNRVKLSIRTTEPSSRR